MGNKNSGLTAKSKCSSPSTKKCQNTKQSKDEFIIAFNRNFDQKEPPSANVFRLQMDPRRVVFVSLIGLFQTYLDCPPHVLYSSLFVLPLKNQWLYDYMISTDTTRNHHDEYTMNPFYTFSLFNSVEATEKFIQLLQYKDAQGLLLCALDEYPEDNKSLIQPFWRHLSDKICTLYDTVTGSKYNALHLDDEWWETQYLSQKHTIKYGTTASDVLNELYFLTMNYRSLQELIYQSNPNLNVITFYGRKTEFYKPTKDVLLSDFVEDLSDSEENEGEWFISIDYEM